MDNIADRTRFNYTDWRAFVQASLEVADGVTLEQLPSGAWRVTKGASHLMTNDLATLRGRELAEFVD
jgi:hypothetical protein